MRDARDKQAGQDQKNSQKNDQAEPMSGEKSPQDPARRMPKGGKPDEAGVDQAKRDDTVPPWAASLPPEIRDAFAGGRAEEIPLRYRHLIRKWQLWMQKHRDANR